MLKLSGNLIDLPILSLRTGHRVGTALAPIINPANLSIEGWYCFDVYNNKKRLILPVGEVREIIDKGIAVDDHDAMTDQEDLIRFKPIIEVDFQIIGKKVVTNLRRRIGKVDDYAVDADTLKVERLYVERPMYKSLSVGQVSIDRRQIIEVNNKKIIIKDIDVKIKDSNASPVQAIA